MAPFGPEVCLWLMDQNDDRTKQYKTKQENPDIFFIEILFETELLNVL